MSFFSKKASDLTVGETLKFAGITSLLSVAICAAPMVWECREEIKNWLREKFKRKEVNTLSTEEEDDNWGV